MFIDIERETKIGYPINYNSIRLNGPTLFYIDEEGTPIQLGLNNDQVKAIVDDWNDQPDDAPEEGYVPHQLKPPVVLG